MELSHILETAVNAVVPIVLLMLLGYFLRWIGFLTPEFNRVGMKLVFNVLLPASLFQTTYNIESISVIPWSLVIYSMLMLTVTFLAAVKLMPMVTPIPERRGPLLQTVVRANSAIIGLPLVEALGGSQEAMVITAVLIAFAVPYMNALAVVALSIYMEDDGHRIGFKKILKNIATNPLLIGTALGFVFVLLRSCQNALFGEVVFSLKEDAPFLFQPISKCAVACTPLALIIMGADFRFSAMGDMKKEIIVGTVNRVLIVPMVGLGLAALLSACTPLLNCGSAEYPGLIALFGTPVAVSSAIMAGQMGNDKQLATQLVVWTSVISILTIFLTVCILMGAGLLIV